MFFCDSTDKDEVKQAAKSPFRPLGIPKILTGKSVLNCPWQLEFWQCPLVKSVWSMFPWVHTFCPQDLTERLNSVPLRRRKDTPGCGRECGHPAESSEVPLDPTHQLMEHYLGLPKVYLKSLRLLHLIKKHLWTERTWEEDVLPFQGQGRKSYCLPGVPFTSLWSMIKDIEIIYCGFVLYYHSLFINKNKNRYFLSITMF